jgi:hypothetical protein
MVDIRSRNMREQTCQEAPLHLFHRATPLSWSVPGPEALCPSITAGLPLFGRVVSTVLGHMFVSVYPPEKLRLFLQQGAERYTADWARHRGPFWTEVKKTESAYSFLMTRSR